MDRKGDFVLRRGDRVVFLGDSITEQQLYTNFVESYLATRYPELKLTFFNAGWGGDSAPGGLNRLDRDVLALDPTVVTICYGMNDGAYARPAEAIRQRFVNGMNGLVSRLKGAGVRVVLLTPGMADERAAPQMAAVRYNGEGLRILADEVLRLAAAEGLPVFDIHRLMTEVDQKARATDPVFCMIPDGGHPDPAGHLVMAFGLLKALGVPPRQLRIDVEMAGKGSITAEGLKVSRFRKVGGGLEVAVKFDRLPFFVEPAARKVLPYLPFQEIFNECRLTVRGLKADHGFVWCRGTGSEAIERVTFERGVNLFGLWSSQYMQAAAAVYGYTVEKNQVYSKMWRVLGLNNLNSPWYNMKPHRAGIRSVPGMDRGRDKLLVRDALAWRLQVVTTSRPAEAEGEFITRWSFRGPFPRPYETDRVGGEAAFTRRVPTLGSDWIAGDLDMSNMGDNLTLVFGPQIEKSAYAVTVIESPVDQEVEFRLGSDDGFSVWLNGEMLAQNYSVWRGVTIDQERMPTRLRKGPNVLMVKITQGRWGAWGFCARFAGFQQAVSVMRPQELSDQRADS